ncbi:MAG: peptidoglycan DD-metalloendopeptidase family protein, partial [Alphaproteobacteria bacterium]|nr:peptidoglycan DD-metalloendopeptidase family protein [Alphaproteobacteria bacterium]
DTLMKILKSSGVSGKQAAILVSPLRKVYDLTRLPIGQTIRMTIIDGPAQPNIETRQLIKLTFSPSFDLEIAAELQENGSFKIDKRKIELIIEEQFVGGNITNSLYQTAVDLHLPINILMEVIRIFSFDVDFQREIRPGDSFGVLFKVYKNHEQQVIHNSTVNWLSMTLRGEKHEYASYTNKAQVMDYYDRKGQSVKKTLMRTPIDGAKLSSKYGKRRHPILGYTKMHKGVDFAAPKGVSIMASGDGVIEYIGDKGPYGNYIRIRHNSIYKTAYAHLSRFRKGLKKGNRVRQGTIIGYVGSTGRSTGPHLHYEVIKYGRQTNPLSVRLPAGDKLKGKALSNLQKYWLELDKKLTKAMTKNTG